MYHPELNNYKIKYAGIRSSTPELQEARKQAREAGTGGGCGSGFGGFKKGNKCGGRGKKATGGGKAPVASKKPPAAIKPPKAAPAPTASGGAPAPAPAAPPARKAGGKKAPAPVPEAPAVSPGFADLFKPSKGLKKGSVKLAGMYETSPAQLLESNKDEIFNRFKKSGQSDSKALFNTQKVVFNAWKQNATESVMRGVGVDPRAIPEAYTNKNLAGLNNFVIGLRKAGKLDRVNLPKDGELLTNKKTGEQAYFKALAYPNQIEAGHIAMESKGGGAAISVGPKEFNNWYDYKKGQLQTFTPKPAKPAKAPKPVAAPPTLENFATSTIEAARRAKAGYFGGGKVFINHVYKEMKKDPKFKGISEEDFKKGLVEANQKRLLDLNRADLVEAMDPRNVAASSTQHRGAEFHFVRIPNAPVVPPLGSKGPGATAVQPAKTPAPAPAPAHRAPTPAAQPAAKPAARPAAAPPTAQKPAGKPANLAPAPLGAQAIQSKPSKLLGSYKRDKIVLKSGVNKINSLPKDMFGSPFTENGLKKRTGLKDSEIYLLKFHGIIKGSGTHGDHFVITSPVHIEGITSAQPKAAAKPAAQPAPVSPRSETQIPAPYRSGTQIPTPPPRKVSPTAPAARATPQSTGARGRAHARPLGMPPGGGLGARPPTAPTLVKPPTTELPTRQDLPPQALALAKPHEAKFWGHHADIPGPFGAGHVKPYEIKGKATPKPPAQPAKRPAKPLKPGAARKFQPSQRFENNLKTFLNSYNLYNNVRRVGNINNPGEVAMLRRNAERGWHGLMAAAKLEGVDTKKLGNVVRQHQERISGRIQKEPRAPWWERERHNPNTLKGQVQKYLKLENDYRKHIGHDTLSDMVVYNNMEGAWKNVKAMAAKQGMGVGELLGHIAHWNGPGKRK